MKPIIGIVGNLLTMEGGLIPNLERAYVNYDYVQAVERLGATAIILPVVEDEESIKNQINLCDGIIISGGHDIHPKFYKQELHKNIGYVYSRVDEYQLSLTKIAIESNKPILGICRGHQLINVVLGGTLYQDLSEYSEKTLKHTQEAKRYEVSHKIHIEKDSRLYKLYNEETWVNSYHHQSIEKLGKNLKVTAKASDGVVESIEHTDKKYVVGVQWHPEMMLSENDDMSLLVRDFISNCKD